jgi:hypothetical protein
MLMDIIDDLLQATYFTDQWGAALLDAVARGSLILLFAAAVAFMARRSAASIR